jgi:beta-glucosidase
VSPARPRLPGGLALALLAGAACDGPLPFFTPAEVDGTALGAELPPGFLLGAATAAHQIEGGQHNDWTEWEAGAYPDGRPHIANRDTSQVAAGSWTRWPQDVEALATLGANAYRLSVEWSRLEPQPGAWDAAAFATYRAQLLALRARGITPVLTLHHYTFPLWVAAQGGWEWSGLPQAMGALAGQVGARLGDLVDVYCTINEPNVAAFDAYLWGDYPPGVQDPVRAGGAYVATLRAHAAMAAALRAQDAVDADGDGHPTRVGMAVNMNVFEPATGSPEDAMMAGFFDDIFNEMVPRAVATGRARVSLPGVVDLDEAVPGLQGTFDYLGINYYQRFLVRFDLSQDTLASQYPPPNRPRSDLGYEVYPEGLLRTLTREARWGWPLYVLESGVADATGALRPGYLRSHLYATVRALRQGVDVRGYFFWSLMDNFEWVDGYAPRLGLFRVDPGDPGLVRRPTPAVATFQQIAREAGHPPMP